MNRCLFLDRDGTLMPDTGYPSSPQDVSLYPKVENALQTAQSNGFLLAIISNQSGVGRGYFDETAMWSVDAELKRQFLVHGIEFNATQYCTDLPGTDGSERKPSPAMIQRVAAELDISISDSWMIGDKLSDVEAGIAAGCKTILFGATAEDLPCPRQTKTCSDWIAVTQILQDEVL